MSFEVIIFEGIVDKEGMGGQRKIADCDSSDEEDVSLGQSQHVLLDLCRSRLSFFSLCLL